MFEEIKIIEKSDVHTAYDCDKVYYVNLKKGASLSDHQHSHIEAIYLMEGEAEIIIGENVQIVKAPIKITIPNNTYHKFTALTDLIGLEIK